MKQHPRPSRRPRLNLVALEDRTTPATFVVNTTAEERLTLITCGGDFDRETGEYEERTVVRARPVAG